MGALLDRLILLRNYRVDPEDRRCIPGSETIILIDLKDKKWVP